MPVISAVTTVQDKFIKLFPQYIPVLMSKAQAPCFKTSIAVAAASTSSAKLSLAQSVCGVCGETAEIS